MAGTLTGKYFIKRGSGIWTDVASMFQGMRILSLNGFNELGESVNVFTQQWIDSQEEDFIVTKQDTNQNDVIIRSNVDLQMTVIISRRYANTNIDEQTVYNNLRAFINGGDFYIKSTYTGMSAHVICTKGFQPTTQKLHRDEKSYIMVTIPLHTLDAPQQG